MHYYFSLPTCDTEKCDKFLFEENVVVEETKKAICDNKDEYDIVPIV